MVYIYPMSKKSTEILGSSQALELLEEGQRKLQLDFDGKPFPFYAWRPGTSRYIGKDEESGTFCDACEKPHHAYFWDDVDEETGIVTRRDGLEFQETLTTSKAFLNAAVTATGAGKTDWLVETCAARAIGEHPIFPGLTWKAPQRIYFGTEARTIDPIFRRLRAQFPNRYILKTIYSKGAEEIFLTNGSTVRMMSYDLPREAWQADQLNALFLDEEPPRHFWAEAMRRMRKDDSQVYLGCTTLKGSTFVHEVFQRFPQRYRNAQEGEISWSGAPMYANPHLPRDYVRRQREMYKNDPEMMEIVVEGKPKCLEGRYIFPEGVLLEMLDTCVGPKGFYVVGTDGIVAQTKVSVGAWKVWKTPEPGHRYVMAADLSEGGLEGDYTACPVLDVDTGEIAALFHGRVEPGPFAVECAAIGRWYHRATVNFEKNMQGAAFLDRIRMIDYPNIALSKNHSGKIRTELQSYGFRTDKASKPLIINALRDALCDKLIRIPDVATLRELQNFGWLRKEDAAAGRHGMGVIGSGHDDLVMALAITWFTARFAPPPKRVLGGLKPLWQRILEGEKRDPTKGRSRLFGGICT